jgi:hypothetical protein
VSGIIHLSRWNQNGEYVMPRVFGLLTASFIVYLLYQVSRAVTRTDDETGRKAPAALPASATPEPVAAEAVIVSPVVARKAAVVPAEKAVQLRNPVDGEKANVPSNYRFAKKWIKEALVAEGLLDKIYKNSELSDANAVKVKAALEQLGQIEKYRA